MSGTSSSGIHFTVPFSFSSLPALPPAAKEILNTLSGIAAPKLTALEQWAKESQQHAIITVIAFGILGLAIVSIGINIIATITHAIIAVTISLCCFAACLIIGYYLVQQQAIRSVQSIRSSFIQMQEIDSARSSIAIQRSRTEEEWKAFREKVMQQNIEIFKTGIYYCRNDSPRVLDQKSAIDKCRTYAPNDSKAQRPGSQFPSLQVTSTDPLSLIPSLSNINLRPIVLVMAASDQCPDYAEGSWSSEKEYYLRTTLAGVLDIKLGKQQRNLFSFTYGNRYESRGLYVPYVAIFREEAEKDYQLMEFPITTAIGILSIPTLLSQKELKRREEEIAYQQLRSFCDMAHHDGHLALVFHIEYPSAQIADLLMTVITKEFAQCFKRIVISVKENGNNTRAFAERILQEGTCMIGEAPLFAEITMEGI